MAQHLAWKEIMIKNQPAATAKTKPNKANFERIRSLMDRLVEGLQRTFLLVNDVIHRFSTRDAGNLLPRRYRHVRISCNIYKYLNVTARLKNGS